MILGIDKEMYVVQTMQETSILTIAFVTKNINYWLNAVTAKSVFKKPIKSYATEFL